MKEFIYVVTIKKEGKAYYFGSLAAIYDVFSPYDIGCKVENLWNLGVSEGNPYENRLCRITREPLVRKAHRMLSRQRK